MKFKIIIICIILFTLLAFTTSKERPVTIFMIGDSTMADKSFNNGNIERGWGQILPEFLTEDIIVDNHAMNGRSSLSFINEGRWDAVLTKLQKGDYVFIQFGHNDEKTAEDLHTIPGGSFDENLRRFVRETRSKGAYPVLFNSIVRRNYPPAGFVGHRYTYEIEGDTLVDTHGEYAESPRRIANEMNIPFVDMTRLTHDLIAGMGPEESKKLFMWVPEGTYDFCPKGKVDNTHLNIYGAKAIAQIAIREVAKIIPELAPFVRYQDARIYVADYKGDKTCGVSYTFDDGLEEHYTLVYPVLEKLGFKGTFWICSKIIEEKESQLGKPRMTWLQMKKMSNNGHEISNHSWSHPNLKRLGPNEIKAEIEKNDSIIFVHTGKMPRTFCYPGNNFNEEIVCIASEDRVGTRTNQLGVGGEVSGSTIELLDKWIKELIISEQWGVAMIHGITYGYDSFSDPDILWEHLGRVKTLEDKIWVDTFARIAAYVKERKNVQLEITRKGSCVHIIPRLSLDPRLFTESLTMVVKNEGFSKMKVEQDGKKLVVNVLKKKATFDFNPFGGEIIINFNYK